MRSGWPPEDDGPGWSAAPRPLPERGAPEVAIGAARENWQQYYGPNYGPTTGQQDFRGYQDYQPARYPNGHVANGFGGAGGYPGGGYPEQGQRIPGATGHRPAYAARGYDGGFAEPRYAEQRHAGPQYAEPAYAEPAYAEPQYDDRAFRDFGYGDPGYADPRYDGPGFADQGYGDQEYPDPRYDEPVHADPRHADPRDHGGGYQSYADPGYADPGYADPGYAERGYDTGAYAPPGHDEAGYGSPGYDNPEYRSQWEGGRPAEAIDLDQSSAEAGYGFRQDEAGGFGDDQEDSRPPAFRGRRLDRGSGRGNGRMGRRRGGSGDHRLWLALGGVLVVATAAIVAVITIAFPSNSGPAHTMVTPNSIGSFTRNVALEKQMNLNQLRMDAVHTSSGQASHVVSAAYEKGTATAGASPQIVMFIGGHIANAAPAASISNFMQEFKGATRTSAGSIGGEAACAPASGTGVGGTLAMCTWFDDDSFGVMLSSTMNTAGLARAMLTMRPEVELTVRQ